MNAGLLVSAYAMLMIAWRDQPLKRLFILIPCALAIAAGAFFASQRPSTVQHAFELSCWFTLSCVAIDTLALIAAKLIHLHNSLRD